MKKIILILLPLMLVACSGGTPSENQAKSVIVADLNKYGEIIDFRKANGEMREIQGQKIYFYHYRAATKLGEGWVWQEGNSLFPTGLFQGTPFGGDTRFPPRTVVPSGSTYAVEGTVHFRITENGWISVGSKVNNYGYCSDKPPAECYKTLWPDSDPSLTMGSTSPCAGYTDNSLASSVTLACLQKIWLDSGCTTTGKNYPRNTNSWWSNSPNGTKPVGCDATHTGTQCGAGNYKTIVNDMRAWATLPDAEHRAGCGRP